MISPHLARKLKYGTLGSRGQREGTPSPPARRRALGSQPISEVARGCPSRLARALSPYRKLRRKSRPALATVASADIAISQPSPPRPGDITPTCDLDIACPTRGGVRPPMSPPRVSCASYISCVSCVSWFASQRASQLASSCASRPQSARHDLAALPPFLASCINLGLRPFGQAPCPILRFLPAIAFMPWVYQSIMRRDIPPLDPAARYGIA